MFNSDVIVILIFMKSYLLKVAVLDIGFLRWNCGIFFSLWSRTFWFIRGYSIFLNVFFFKGTLYALSTVLSVCLVIRFGLGQLKRVPYDLVLFKHLWNATSSWCSLNWVHFCVSPYFSLLIAEIMYYLKCLVLCL